MELTRVIGQPALTMLDPFLLLHAFRSDRPADDIAGFPPHPHRGFETVTYLLAGRVRHLDSARHEGVIEAGGVQWMSAGSGVVHSELPEQQDGLLAGFQLWVNRPARHKMDPPAYQEHRSEQIPLETRAGGARVKVIAGETGHGTRGPVVQPLTRPQYLDVALPPGGVFEEGLDSELNAFVYVIEGRLVALDLDAAAVELEPDQLGVLAHGERVRLTAAAAGARFLLVAGAPLHEPVARGGPFVMNTLAEVQQAEADFAAGRF